MIRNLLLFFLLSLPCISSYSQNIQGSLRRGSSDQHLRMAIKNNGTTVVTANLNSFKFTLAYGGYDRVTDMVFLPTGAIESNPVSHSTYYRQGDKSLITWTGVLPITLNPGEVIDLVDFYVYNLAYPTLPNPNSSRIRLMGGRIEIVHEWSVIMNNEEVSDQVDRFFDSGDLIIHPNGSVGLMNSSLSSEATAEVWVNAVLPVKLKSMSANSENENVLLRWSTTEESNSRSFEIEWAKDAKNWQTIGAVESKGESSNVEDYTFNHINAAKGENYYRLKMIDKDQTFAYSKIVSINVAEGNYLSVYPNPSSDYLKIVSKEKNIQSVELFDKSGKLVVDTINRDGIIDVRRIKSGTYFARILLDNGDTEISKVLIVD